MGYTHYFKTKKTLAKETFKELGVDVRKIIKEAADSGIYLADGAGTVGTSPIIKPEFIAFNGMNYSSTGGEDGSHETMFIDPSEVGFAFCKTARKPYDLAVMASLIALKKHFPNVEISSDGDKEDWVDGTEFCEKLLGYGGNFNIDVGDFEDEEDEDIEVMTKEEVVNFLSESELDTIRQEVIQDRGEYLLGMIKNGVTGFSNLSEDDLIEEYRQATDNEIKIKG